MILRLLPIFVTMGALLALWFGYGQLKEFRGTAFWDYRYIIFTSAAFLGLSVLEWVLGWIKIKTRTRADPS